MAAVLGWGLWNPRLTEWFNPGGKRPYVKSREEAERMIQSALRQYPVGTWEPREYLAEDDSESEGEDVTDRPDAARPGMETPAAPRRGA
jgi:hypothetical protein